MAKLNKPESEHEEALGDIVKQTWMRYIHSPADAVSCVLWLHRGAYKAAHIALVNDLGLNEAQSARTLKTLREYL